MRKTMVKIKENKGITLIALIVTIIVLLILAGISVSLIMNDGIIYMASEATIRSKVAEVDEALKLKVNEEKIIRYTEPGVGDGNYMEWENTPFMNVLEMFISEEGMMYYGVGNVYDKATGEKIKENLAWFPSDLIEIKEGADPNNSPGFDLGINIDIGNNGYMEEAMKYFEQTLSMPTTDVFVFDKNYNIYYLDENGNMYTAGDKYNSDEIMIGKTYFNPDNLSPEDRKVYDGIYNGALEFTGNKEYARYLASNDFDLFAIKNTFMFSGVNFVNIADADGNIILENLALLITRPDWTTEQLFNDPVKKHYYMDSKYKMYELDYSDNTNKVIKDKDGNEIANHIKEVNTMIEKEYKGYKYAERFDNRFVIVSAVPEQEVVDMKTDLAGLNVFAVGDVFSENTVTKRVIFPETMKDLTVSALSKSMTDTSVGGIYSDSTTLEYVELPNSLQRIYVNTFKGCTNLKEVVMPDNLEAIGLDAFKGCDGVTLKFKDGKAPEGAPWGGTNINITSK